MTLRIEKTMFKEETTVSNEYDHRALELTHEKQKSFRAPNKQKEERSQVRNRER